MFNITDKNKKYQCPSEFGLYKCEDTNDCYSVRKKSRFGFGYLVVLLTSVIVLSSVCVVLYSFISSSNAKQKPLLIKNQSQPFTEINTTTFIPYINISIVNGLSNEDIGNQTESSDSELKSEKTEPQALEYSSHDIRHFFPESNIPRPFIYEIRDPKPAGFQAPFNNNPKIYEDNEAAENNAKPIRTKVKNIQDIIKLLTNQNEDQDTENSNKKIKFNRNQKKLGLHSKRKNSHPFASDPFFPYKPQNPSDINLLATNGFRFAPTIQLDPKKKHQFMEQYPNYERPMDSKDFNYPEQPISVTLDLTQNKRLKKRKPNNTPVGFNNLYNQNQYFNPGNRYQPSQQFNKQQYFRPWNHWNLAPNANRQKIRNGMLEQTIKGQSPMIVHLNLYPKKRKPSIEDTEIEESKIHHNCSDYYDGYNFAQNKNASEFNQLLGQTRHQTLDPIYNGKVTTTTTDNYNENMYNVKDESHPHQFVSKPNVEIQKSIGFTIVNPNFSGAHSSEGDFYSNGESESQWHPIIIPDDENVSNARDDRVEESNKDNHYGLEVGEVNEGSDETVTLPLPQDLFQKYFNSKPTTSKYNEDWDPNVIRQNPNLINHRASFFDERKSTKDNI